MKRNEPYNPHLKSTQPPSGLLFRKPNLGDVNALTRLMSERNPQDDIELLYNRTKREIRLCDSDPLYQLFVAELDEKVIGFTRYIHSEGLPKERIKFSAPSGWYGMGILVESSLRRKGIARFLFQQRLVELRKHGASSLYSVVDEMNLTSIRMHHEFGFYEVSRAAGFLQIKLESGSGILFKLDMSSAPVRSYVWLHHEIKNCPDYHKTETLFIKGS